MGSTISSAKNLSNPVIRKKNANIIYEYKKYEKFDFGDLNIEGEKGALGDLSINPRYQINFQNELPSKKNFHKEMIDAVESML